MWRATVWNNLIRSLSFSYINVCLYLLVYIQSVTEWTWVETYSVVIGFYLLLMYPLFLGYVIKCNWGHLNSKFVNERMQMLKVNPRLKDKFFARYNYPLFIFRRFFLVFTVLFFNKWPGIQIQVLIMHQCAYLICLDFPRSDKNGRQLELMNEFIMIVLFYHMACFTSFVLDPLIQYQMSHSFLGILGVTVAINFYTIFSYQVRLIILKLSKKYRDIQQMKKKRPGLEIEIKIQNKPIKILRLAKPIRLQGTHDAGVLVNRENLTIQRQITVQSVDSEKEETRVIITSIRSGKKKGSKKPITSEGPPRQLSPLVANSL
jgi:hypothetical protein